MKSIQSISEFSFRSYPVFPGLLNRTVNYASVILECLVC